MDSQKIFALLMLLSSFIQFSFQKGVINFTPPAKMNCRDDEDMAKYCAEWKGKGYCESKRSLMVAACSETCEYCSKETFSKNIDDIIKDQQVIEEVTGDLQKTEEGLEQGNASPSSQGSFQGKGGTAAEQEATEVPNRPGAEEIEKASEDSNKPGSKGDKQNQGAPGQEQGEGQGEGQGEQPGEQQGEEQGDKEGEKQGDKEGEKQGKESGEGTEPKKAPSSGKVGSTSGCDEACQKECIDTHNKYRANHGAPPLTFDQTLADQAQAHADKVAADGRFRHSDWAAGKGGECISAGWNKPSWTIAVKDWHDEEKDYDYNTGKSKSGNAVGHFTQIVWKKAKKAGCGKSMMNGPGLKGPFYITQMDVVGVVTDSLPGYEKENVGRPKKPDMDWFKDLWEKQNAELMKTRPWENRRKRNLKAEMKKFKIIRPYRNKSKIFN